VPFRRDGRNPEIVQRGEITIARFVENTASEGRLNMLLLFNLDKRKVKAD